MELFGIVVCIDSVEVGGGRGKTAPPGWVPSWILRNYRLRIAPTSDERDWTHGGGTSAESPAPTQKKLRKCSDYNRELFLNLSSFSIDCGRAGACWTGAVMGGWAGYEGTALATKPLGWVSNGLTAASAGQSAFNLGTGAAPDTGLWITGLQSTIAVRGVVDEPTLNVALSGTALAITLSHIAEPCEP